MPLDYSKIEQSKLPPQLLKVARISRLMDSQFRIPGTSFTFGLDPILGLIPGLGDLVTYGISIYLLMAMVKNGASGRAVAKMVVNITLDAFAGLIPVVGQVFDFVYKANQRNLIIAVEHFDEGKHQGSAWPYIIPVFIVLLLLFTLLALLLFYLIKWSWLLLTTLLQ